MAVKFGAEEDVTQEEIREKLRLHRLWVDREEGGARADLSDADLRWADLSGANLHGANLHGANLGKADLHGADLGNANLGKAILRGANLHGANLGKAILRGANLHGANLGKAILRGATGNGREIKSAEVHTYSLVWTKDVLWIGCQRRTLDEWELFDPLLEGMDEEDCAAWEAHKDWIFETVRRFPAE